MSFCYLLNAALLFAGVLGFIVAGFAGTFSQRLYDRRYRLMLGPLGFVVLGSLAHSITARLVEWYSHVHPAFHVTHPAGLGSGADIFESFMLIAAGLAGAFCGVALGATLEREQTADATYTIANYWNRRTENTRSATAAAPALSPAESRVRKPRKSNVIAISRGRRQSPRVKTVTTVTTPLSKTE